MQHQPYQLHHQNSGAHVSLGGMNYGVGAMVTAKLAERFKATCGKVLDHGRGRWRHRHAETMWRDYRRSQEKAERKAEREQEGSAGASG